jgi:hypothetical protein
VSWLARERMTRTGAWALGVLVLLLAAAIVPLSLVARQNLATATGPQSAASVAFAAVGLVVAQHRPRNPIGWLMLGVGAGILLYTDTGLYNVISYRLGHRLPAAPAVLLLFQASEPVLGLLPLVILAFPDGRLPSRRWRWIVRCYLLVALADLAVLIQMGIYALTSHHTAVDPGGQLELATHVRGYQAVSAPVALIFAALWLIAVVYQMLRWRRSAGEARQQLNWLMAGGAAALASFGLAAALGAAPGIWRVLSDVVLVGIAALPVGMGVAILKYRLYEIDRIISRTLAYAIVTGLLVGVYAGLVLLSRLVFAASSPVAVAASTLAAAALFNPLRRRVQTAVDRRFNRVRYDADRMVEAFAVRLKDHTDLDTVRSALAFAVSQALEPAHVTVWNVRHERR